MSDVWLGMGTFGDVIRSDDFARYDSIEDAVAAFDNQGVFHCAMVLDEEPIDGNGFTPIGVFNKGYWEYMGEGYHSPEFIEVYKQHTGVSGE